MLYIKFCISQINLQFAHPLECINLKYRSNCYVLIKYYCFYLDNDETPVHFVHASCSMSAVIRNICGIR